MAGTARGRVAGRHGRDVKKRALEVADRIEQSIHESGWPVGSTLGDEGTLLADYDVGRGVLRQAIRLVEHLGIARARRGRFGGLVVEQPGPRPAALTLRIGWSQDRVVARSTRRLVQIIDGWAETGPEGASIVQRFVTDASVAFNTRIELGRPGRRSKRGEQVAGNIIAELVERRWDSSRLLGSEDDLMNAFHAGRSGLREAVHLLELHGAAAMQRGPGGGLLVLSASSAGAIPRSVRAQFHARQLGDGSMTTVMASLLSALPSEAALPAGRPLRLAAAELLDGA